MGRKSELRAISYISIDGSPPVRFDSLSPEKRAECVKILRSKIEETLSTYLSEHPKEAIPLIKNA